MKDALITVVLLMAVIGGFTLGLAFADITYKPLIAVKDSIIMQKDMQLDTASKELFYCKYPEQR